MEYAKQATDLVLEHLKDALKQDRVDRDLLTKLGWTKADLRRFVGRWQQMYRDADSPGSAGIAAREELDEALQSLGLTSKRIFRRAGRADDQLRRLREAPRTSPPVEYQQQMQAYLRGTSRATIPNRSVP